MIKKDKVYELKIEEDDDASGIDSISLVDEPAIEVNWVAFKKEKEHEFHIPDGEDETYLEKLAPFAQSEQELLDEGFEIDTIEYINKKEFTYSYPNAASEIDTPYFRTRYKYVLNPQASGPAVIETTRQFCKTLINNQLVFRIEDMLEQRNDMGQSFADWRGGYNCRHLFAKIVYKKKGYIPNDARGKHIDGYDILGSPQNDTRTSNPSFAKEDNNPCWKGYEQIGTKMLNGKEVPNCVPIKKEDMEDIHLDYPDSVKHNAQRVLNWVKENGWGSCGTSVGKQRANQLAKGEPISKDTIKRMYSYLSRHKNDLIPSKGYGDGCGKLMYDSWGGLSALSWAESKVKSFGYDVSTLPAYVDEVPKKKNKVIPKAINAESEFINQFEYLVNKQDMSKQYFAQDNEKQMVLGPAMIPNQKIFRKDPVGNPYYVYFSPETIKMIASKYMKNKYIDNNDQMHDGNAVKDVYVVESWIKESNNDKSTDYGFEKLPIGTWFVSMKINNPDVWAKVKEHELNGFSVSGYFQEVAEFKSEVVFLSKLAEILRNIND
jgi:hypothetical protein